eukprot:1598866-Alexandrium_andersonii.AAC.1
MSTSQCARAVTLCLAFVLLSRARAQRRGCLRTASSIPRVTPSSPAVQRFYMFSNSPWRCCERRF